MEMTPQELVSLFTTMSPADKEAVANALSASLWDVTRSRALRDGKQENNVRFLIGGEDVVRDGDGTPVGFGGGKSQFDIVNFDNATGYIDSANNARQLNIRSGGGGGLSTCYDYVVSPCWADEVAAGRGTEGQEVSLFTGCTTKIFSLYQPVITDIALQASGSEWAVLVCGVTTENIIVPAMNSGPDHIITHGVGAGTGNPGRAGFVGVSGSASSVFSIRQGAPRMTVKNIWIGTAFSNTTLVAHQTSCSSEWENCTFFTSSSSAGGFDCGSGIHISIRGCYFNGSPGAGTVGAAVLDNPDDVTIADCEFTGSWGIDFAGQDAADIVIVGNRFTSGRIKVRRFGRLTITGNKLQGHTSLPEIELGGGNTQDAVITGNSIGCSVTNTNQPGILLAASGQLRDIAISGNTFNFRANNQPFILSQNTDCQFVAVVGNVFGRTGTGYLIAQVIGVQGTFSNSVFGPNAPGVRTKYNVTGTENEFYPPTSSTGSSTSGLAFINEIYISLGETYAVQF